MTASLGETSGNCRACAHNIGEYANAQINLDWLPCTEHRSRYFIHSSGRCGLDFTPYPDLYPVTGQLVYGGVEFTIQ